MEIKNLNSKMINAYKSVGGNPAKSGKPASAEAERRGGDNFDKVEFNFGRSIEAAKTNIASEVSASASNARIELLRQAYEGDSLPVTPEQIAETIVG